VRVQELRCPRLLRISPGKAREPARTQVLDGHGTTAGGSRPSGHRTLVGTRVGRDKADYLEANLAMKEEILATIPPGGKPGRYRPGDALLAFLKNLWPELEPPRYSPEPGIVATTPAPE